MIAHFSYITLRTNIDSKINSRNLANIWREKKQMTFSNKDQIKVVISDVH